MGLSYFIVLGRYVTFLCYSHPRGAVQAAVLALSGPTALWAALIHSFRPSVDISTSPWRSVWKTGYPILLAGATVGKDADAGESSDENGEQSAQLEDLLGCGEKSDGGGSWGGEGSLAAGLDPQLSVSLLQPE